MPLALFCILTWSTSFVGLSYALKAFDPDALAFIRFFFAGVCALAWLLWKREKLPTWQDLLRLIFCGVIGIAFYGVCLNYGQMTLSAGLTSFITGIFPLVTLLLSALFLKEERGKFLLIGMLISLCGIFVIALSRGIGQLDWAVLLVAISASVGASASVVQKTMLPRIAPLTQSAWTIVLGALALTPFAKAGFTQFAMAPLVQQVNVIYLGVVPAFIAYSVYAVYMSRVGAAKASSIMYAVPFFAALLGYLILGQTLSIMGLIGGLIALLGVIIARIKSTPKSTT